MYYRGSRKALLDVLEDVPAPPSLSRRPGIPVSATFGAKSSSTSTLAVLKFIWIAGGVRECRWLRPE
jgi:hypothetical protein